MAPKRPKKLLGPAYERKDRNSVFSGMVESNRGQEVDTPRGKEFVRHKTSVDLGRRHPQGQIGAPKGMRDRRKGSFVFTVETRHRNEIGITGKAGIKGKRIPKSSPKYKSEVRMTTRRADDLIGAEVPFRKAKSK